MHRLKYLELDAVKEKTAAIRIQMKNLVDEACFQVEIPVITTKRKIESGEQLFVDYTGGKKNTYLLSSRKIAQLISEGKITNSQVSSCLNGAGKLCSCGRFFIIPTPQQPSCETIMISSESVEVEDVKEDAEPIQFSPDLVVNLCHHVLSFPTGEGEAGVDLLLSPPSPLVETSRSNMEVTTGASEKKGIIAFEFSLIETITNFAYSTTETPETGIDNDDSLPPLSEFLLVHSFSDEQKGKF